MQSFCLRATATAGTPGWQFQLATLAGSVWVDAGTPVSVGPWSCNGKSISETRDFFLATAGANGRFADIGSCLWQLIGQPEFAPVWGAAFKGLEPFRLYLDLAGDVSGDLADLPWELLNRDFPHCCLLRLARWDVRAESRMWPVRLMVVNGAAPLDNAVKAEAEIEAIRGVLRDFNRSIFLKVVERPLEKDLRNELNDFRPQIIHFIGHGGLIDDETCLKFRLPGGNAWDWTRAGIASLLLEYEQQTRCKIKMAVLNACRTSGTPPAANDLRTTHDLAAAFLARVSCVIAMQSDVDGEMAGIFARKLYRQIAAGDCVDMALRAARNEVKLTPGPGSDRREPYSPCITITGTPEQVIAVPALEPNRNALIQRTKAFEVVKMFVGREDQRRDVFNTLEPPCQQTPSQALFVVKGPDWNEFAPFPPGKTWFANWCMEGCARHGYEVRWVPVVGEKGGNFIDLMRAIRDGDPQQKLSFVHRPLDAAAFREFNHTLNSLLSEQGGLMPLPPGDSEIADQRLPVDITRINDEKFLEKVCAPFRTALLRCAARLPLLLVLDDFAKGTAVFPQTDFKTFLEYVLLPLTDDEQRRVRVMLLLNETKFREYGFADLPAAIYKIIDLVDLQANCFPDIAWEYLERTSSRLLSDPDFAHRLLEKKCSSIAAGWRISLLSKYAKSLEDVI